MLKDWLTQFTSPDDAACEAAAVVLGRQDSPGLVILAELLAFPSVDVRFWAVRGLWANGSPPAITLLIQALQDQEVLVRSGSAMALGELQAATALDDLAALMTNDPLAPGEHAADALTKIGSVAVPPLLHALQDERSWVRVRAAKALVPIESKQAIPALFEALDDESYVVQYHAEEALARMGVGQMVYFRV